MSQPTALTLSNVAGATFRAALNVITNAIFSNNSGASAPSVTTDCMWHADTDDAKMMLRDTGDSAWHHIFDLDEDYGGLFHLGGAAQKATKGKRAGTATLSDGANISWDLDDANDFTVTLAGNRTLDNPSNMTTGHKGIIIVNQDGTGSRTLSFGSYFKWAGGTAPTLTTTASAVDVIAYEVITATSIACAVALDVK